VKNKIIIAPRQSCKTEYIVREAYNSAFRIGPSKVIIVVSLRIRIDEECRRLKNVIPLAIGHTHTIMNNVNIISTSPRTYDDLLENVCAIYWDEPFCGPTENLRELFIEAENRNIKQEMVGTPNIYDKVQKITKFVDTHDYWEIEHFVPGEKITLREI